MGTFFLNDGDTQKTKYPVKGETKWERTEHRAGQIVRGLRKDNTK